MTTGEIIKDLLYQRGLKQADLAHYLGVSPNTVNRWIPTENKVGTEPSITNIKRIADFFGVSPDIISGKSGKYGSDEHYQFLTKKWEKIEALENLLRSFGYNIDNNSASCKMERKIDTDDNSDSCIDYDSDEPIIINKPTEYTVSWDNEERKILVQDADAFLRKLEKHIRIELEEYF